MRVRLIGLPTDSHSAHLRGAAAAPTMVTSPIVGADIVELNPGRDVDGGTATLAAKLIKGLAALSAKGAP